VGTALAAGCGQQLTSFYGESEMGNQALANSQAINQATAWVRKNLAARVDPEKLVQALMKQGWPEFDARQLLDQVMTAPAVNPAAPQRTINYASPQPKAQRQVVYSDSGPHIRRMTIGAVMLVIGLVITIGSYSMASSSPGGGTYLLCWGPIIFGFIRLITGFIGWMGS
jgi:hypothetical protein